MFFGIICFPRRGCETGDSEGDSIRIKAGDFEVLERSLEIGDYLWPILVRPYPSKRLCTYAYSKFSASANTRSVVPFSAPGFKHTTKLFSPSHVASEQVLSSKRTFVCPVLKSRTLISALLLCFSKDHDCTVNRPKVPSALGLTLDLRGAEMRALGVNFAQTVMVEAVQGL